MKAVFEHESTIRAVALSTPSGFLAFGFGAGLIRFAPGTMGTLTAVPIAILLKTLHAPLFWTLLVVFFLLGIWLCGVTALRLDQHDPGGIVWDEMVAYWLVIAFLPMHWVWWLAAFILFRFFDIVKPWPIRKIERIFKGGLGIMIDDVIAAIYTLVALALAGRFFQ